MTHRDALAQRKGALEAAAHRRACIERLSDALKHPTAITHDNRARWIGRWLHRLAHGTNMSRRTLGVTLRDLPGSCRVCGRLGHMRLGLQTYCVAHRDRATLHYTLARIAYYHEKDASAWEKELNAKDAIEKRRHSLHAAKQG